MGKTDSKAPTKPDYSFETTWIEKGFDIVAGVDEAGRGPWAGPVVAGAVILDGHNIPDGLNDSKKLSQARREELFEKICNAAIFGVGIVDVETIDEINILQATMLAMTKAVEDLSKSPGAVLIDGNKAPPVKGSVQTIKKGDALSLSIAAASIIAKVTRDHIMQDLDKQFPQFGFARHKGYGTAIHAEALKFHGPCAHHRKSFAPIRALLDGSCRP